MRMPTQKSSVVWEEFQTHASEMLLAWRQDADFSDVTLVCEDNQQILAHKVILASSSTLIKKMIQNSKHSHPLLYFWGVKYRDLANVVDFMYKGKVEVYQSDLEDFLALANMLGVKGLNENLETEEFNKSERKSIKHEANNDLEYEEPTQDLKKRINHIVNSQSNIMAAVEQGESDQSSHGDISGHENKSHTLSIPTGHKAGYWAHYTKVPGDETTVICQVNDCGVMVSRGKKDGPKKNLSPTGMKVHLKNHHTTEWNQVQRDRQNCANTK